jgi:hypothetical protein
LLADEEPAVEGLRDVDDVDVVVIMACGATNPCGSETVRVIPALVVPCCCINARSVFTSPVTVLK